MKKTTWLTLLMAAALMAAASCGDNSGDVQPKDTTPADTEPAETEEDYYETIGEHDFGGDTFAIVYSADQLGAAWPYEAEAENGDILNDSVYRRNNNVMDRFNCKVVYDNKGGDWDKQIAAFRNAVMAGDQSYQLCINHMYAGFNAAITDGLLYDFNELPVIDLTKPWWNQTIRENLAVDGVLLTEVSDLVFAYYDVIYFNKQIMDEYDIPYPYDKVKDGTWTWDYLASITKLAGKDMNGDNKFDTEDSYGYLVDQNVSTMTRLVHSNGLLMAELDKNGHPTLENMMSSKMQSVAEKYYDLVWNDHTYYAAHTGDVHCVDMFHDGKGMMMHIQTNRLPQLRDVTFEFGIVPLPKYDEQQKDYRSMASSQMLLLPADMTDPEFEGTVLEALSYESYKEVIPCLYDVVYENKLLRDSESQEMFKLIRNSLVYDINWIYGNGSNLSYLIGRTVGEGDKDIASYYAKEFPACQEVLDKVYEDISANYGN